MAQGRWKRRFFCIAFERLQGVAVALQVAEQDHIVSGTGEFIGELT